MKKDRVWQRAHRQRLSRRMTKKPSSNQLISDAEIQAEIDEKEKYKIFQLKEFNNRRRGLPKVDVVRGDFWGPNGKIKGAIKIVAPKVLSLKRNYRAFLAFIYEIRLQFFKSQIKKRKAKSLYVADLSSVEQMQIDTALILVAEYDRLCKHAGFKPYIDDKGWDPLVRAAFASLGFYELVNSSGNSSGITDELSHPDWQWVKFQSASSINGEDSDRLIADLEAIVGAAPERSLIYDALVEASTNCLNHAYEFEGVRPLEPIINRWWATGAYEKPSRKLHFLVYDQGIGIPNSLPKRAWYDSVLKGCPIEFNDSHVIAAALKLGRTSTELRGRGNGLWRMAELVASLPGSHMNIKSGFGEVKYYSDGRIKHKKLSDMFTGTLVWWVLRMPDDLPKDIET